MKHLKKIIPFVLAAMLAIAPCFMAFADGGSGSSSGGGSSSTVTKGTITVTNAVVGKEYTIYKVFDANYKSIDSGKAVSYSIKDTTENADLIAAIRAGKDGCPFKIVGDKNADGSYTIEHVNLNDTAAVAAGRGWLKNHIGLIKQYKDTKVCEEGKTEVKFTNLDFGYYMMWPGGYVETVIVSVNNVTPDAVMIDKNPTGPSNPKKEADDHLIAVGDTVNYTISFNATNYDTIYSEAGETQGSSQTDKIKEYKITDKYENQTFNKDSVVVTVGDETLVEGPQADGTYTYAITSTPDEKGGGTTEYTIPWMKSDGTFKYPDNSVVTITYTTTMNKYAVEDDEVFYEHNKATIQYKNESNSKYITIGEPEENVWTTGISIKKIDGANDLTGAKFVLFKADENGQTESGTNSGTNSGVQSGDNSGTNSGTTDLTKRKYYKWDETNGKPVWNSPDPSKNLEDYADVIEADNNFHTCEFKGLDAGTYYMEEVVVPEGYKKPAAPFKVVITGTEVTDETSKVIGVEIKGTVDGKKADPYVYPNGDVNPYITAEIVNSTGSSLPTTGGTGTLVLIIVGIIAFLGTAIVLVTKKRMYNQG